MINVALTHDVDRVKKHYQYFTYLIKSLKSKNYKQTLYHLSSSMKSEPYWNFQTIMKIECSYNLNSTFFFMNESIKFNLFKKKSWSLSLGRYNFKMLEIKKIIKQLDKSGWEIGLHGSYNSFNNIELLLKEKIDLEKIVGHKIKGIIQHHLNLNNKTWALQKKCGFEYDSTFGYKNNFGFKDDRSKYFKPFNDYFVVFPLTIMDIYFVNMKNKWERFKRVIEIIDNNNSLLVINWHQRVFNEKEFPGFGEDYIKIIEECIKRGANFFTLGDYFSAISN